MLHLQMFFVMILCFRNFYLSNDPILGNCFTFNSGWNDSVPVFTSYRSGTRFGLRLTLSVGTDEYIRTMAESTGIRVVIHNQTITPFPEETGMLAKPGLLTSIGIKKVCKSY